MNESDIQETLFSLYLRLNGYFVTGFIVHAQEGNLTEMDSLAVRFPFHKEPEREISTCPYLSVSDEKTDFLICEVKGSIKSINFNYAFRENDDSVKSVLNRFGAFTDSEIDIIVPDILNKLEPQNIKKLDDFPLIEVNEKNSQIRCILVASHQQRKDNKGKSYIFGDDIMNYIWECFRPQNRRINCAVQYNWSLWGEQYLDIVKYFKDKKRTEPGNIEDVYKYLE